MVSSFEVRLGLVVMAMCLAPWGNAQADEKAAPPKLQQLKTGQGVEFLMLGEAGTKPKPVIVCLAGVGTDALQTEPYAVSGRELVRRGWLAVSLDLPGHGKQWRKGEPQGIEAWRTRIEKGEAFVDELALRVSAVLDHLIAEKVVDPERMAIEGTSRGGFMAAHLAAREPRFKAVMMYAPVTDLQYIREFQSIKEHPGLQALATSKIADKVAGRRVWAIIGNDDERVDSDSAIRFTREIVRAAKAKKLPLTVTLHVSATPGHSSDGSMHREAVEWLVKQLP